MRIGLELVCPSDFLDTQDYVISGSVLDDSTPLFKVGSLFTVRWWGRRNAGYMRWRR